MTPAEVETRKSKLETGEKRGKTTHPVTLPFLLEVGCEEIPARCLCNAQVELGERVRTALTEARLLPAAGAGADRAPQDSKPKLRNSKGEAQDPELVAEPLLYTYSTPRRLVVHLHAILARQPDKVEEVLGPPVRVAVDAEGKYTRAAESFAQKNSAGLEDLARTFTPKGEYLALRKATPGRTAQEILPEILPGAILGMSFPKSMYWTGKSEPRFVRPIRWVLAVLGEGKRARTVDFEVLGVPSGNFSYGHRVYSKSRIIARGFSDYAAKLGRAYVQHDREMRRQAFRSKIKGLLEDSLKLIEDPELEEWVVNSTEWLSAVRGVFDERFLHLPREILITVMRDHQKYFAVENREGKLEPYFVAILNVDSDERGLIRQGHERVLRARFSDAEFFWVTDLKKTLSERIPLLGGITYQAGLGSYAEKVSRMKTIAAGLCESFEAYPVAFVPSDYGGPASGLSKQPVKVRFTAEHARNTLRAVELCKCDLTTQMVQEFPELQGIVGGLYVGAQPLTESSEVAEAIYDHYLPRGAEDRCPRSVVGAVVSLADKLDGVVTGFAVGREPTGSSDPFAIRRQASGIIKVILEYSVPISLEKAVNQALEAYDTQHVSTALAGEFGVPGASQAQQAFAGKWSTLLQKVPSAVLEFLSERLHYHLESVRGFRYDTVRAVLAAGFDAPADALARAEALETLRGKEDLEVLCTAAKRIRNILVKSATAADWDSGEVEPALLKEPQERELYDLYAKVAAEAGRRRGGKDYRGALEEISTLRPAVDRFFDKVLVMAEDRAIRQNRLRLLKKLDELFSGIALFAEIERG